MGGVVKSFPGVRNRWLFRMVATAAAALALPLAALAAPASGAAAQAGGTARTAADTASCPWLNQSLPVAQRVSMLMAQMTLADARVAVRHVSDLLGPVSALHGRAVPAPPTGATLENNYSASVAMEYRGHWVRVSRPHASAEIVEQCKKLAVAAFGQARQRRPPAVPAVVEKLDGGYPYEIGTGTIRAIHVEFEYNGKRLFYGDTIL